MNRTRRPSEAAITSQRGWVSCVPDAVRAICMALAVSLVACAATQKPLKMRVGPMKNVQYGETLDDRPERSTNYQLWTDLGDGIIYEWLNGGWRLHGYLDFKQNWPRPDFDDPVIPTWEVYMDGTKCTIERER